MATSTARNGPRVAAFHDSILHRRASSPGAHEAPLRNEQDETQSPVPANGGHEPWLAGRLLLAIAVCLLIIGAAIAYERFG